MCVYVCVLLVDFVHLWKSGTERSTRYRSHQVVTDQPDFHSFCPTRCEHVRRLLVPRSPEIRTVRTVYTPFLFGVCAPGTALYIPLTTERPNSILCANRDEALARPTLPASFHSFEALSTTNPVSSSSSASSASKHDGHSSAEDKVERRGSVLSGRDVLAGGTWLGINKSTGRVAFT